jgi:hypothetical protein
MRAYLIASAFLATAACSGGGEENKAEEAPAALAAGQWEVASEVTAFRSTDKALPALKAAVGDKATSTACIEKGDEDKPKPELFAGTGYECKYRETYFRRGRINASLSCERESIEGEIMMNVEGKYTAAGFEGTVTATSFLRGEGDFAMTSKITGRKTADACAPAAEKDAKKG